MNTCLASKVYTPFLWHVTKYCVLTQLCISPMCSRNSKAFASDLLEYMWISDSWTTDWTFITGRYQNNFKSLKSIHTLT